MQLICALSMIACAVSDPGCGYIAQRHYVLNVPFEQAVARLTPEDNQRKIYEACDANLETVEREALELFPLPLRIRRRARFRLRLPLSARQLESVERVELHDGRMTITTSLARGDWKVRQLDVKIVLTRASDGRTHVSTYASMQVNGFGQNFGCLLSSATLERLECGLCWATQKPAER